MRFLSVLKGDIRFQFRYGFYFIYALFTLLYVLILQLVGEQWQARVAVLMMVLTVMMLAQRQKE